MSYFETSELRDSLLADMVRPEDIADAENYVGDVARSFGVTPEDIAVPIPYRVKQLAMAYTLMVCARNGSIMNVKCSDGDDAYEMKRRVYQREVDRLTNAMTKEILTGLPAAEPGVVTIERG